MLVRLTGTGFIAEFLLIIALLSGRAAAGSDPELFLFSLTDEIGLKLRLDRTGAVFLGVIAIVWVLAGFYAFEYMKHEQNNKRYFAFCLMSLGVLAGLCEAGTLITYYVFYELMTIMTFALVIHNQSREAIHAALKYLFYSFAGAYMVLFGIFFLYRESSLSPVIPVFFILLGFSVKAGMFPLHGWLPTAHPVAPAPASAVLSAIIVKAGVLGILRLLFEEPAAACFAGSWVQTLLTVLSVITVFMGSMLAYREQVFKKRLAYSTVSQVSYILFGIFAAPSSATAFRGAMLHVAAHAMIKSALFLIAGAIIYHTGCTRVDELRGIGKKMPVLMWCFTICSLGLIGIPPFGGYVSKWYLGTGVLADPSSGVPGLIGVIVLLISALLTAGYLLPISINAFLPGKDFRDEVLTAERGRENAAAGDAAAGSAAVGNAAAGDAVAGGLPEVRVPEKIFAPAYLKGSEPKTMMLVPIIILTVLSVLIGLLPEVIL
ncbi:MAG: proton-conducting membrane transporter [Lachnospiraceae bacterium]|nr:proton-conducting membrane transporter [Lachnospiraceae bacterium]